MRSEKLSEICDMYADKGCRSTCPLSQACEMKAGDTKEAFIARLNAEAEKIEWHKEELAA